MTNQVHNIFTSNVPLIILSAILVFIAENVCSCHAVLTVIAMLPALHALRQNRHYKLALLFAATHTAALFGFIWYSLPATWLSSDLHILHQFILILILHIILAVFVGFPYFVWAKIYQKLDLNIKNIQLLSVLYVAAAILSSILFALLMYSPYNNNFNHLFSLHYFAYSLIDSPVFIGASALLGVFALIFMAVQFNLLFYKILILIKYQDFKKAKEYFIYLFVIVVMLVASSAFVYKIRKNNLEKADANILIVNSNIQFHKLNEKNVAQALHDLENRTAMMLSEFKKKDKPILLIVPEALHNLSLNINLPPKTYLQGSLEYKDLVSGKLINEVFVRSNEFEMSRSKFYLAQFGEYMPYAFTKIWNLLENYLYLPKKKRIEYRVTDNRFITFDFAGITIVPILCSENLDATLFLKLPKNTKIITSSNSLSIFSNKLFEQKMIRIFKVLAIASNKSLYFASNAANSGLILSNGESELFKDSVLVPLILINNQ